MCENQDLNGFQKNLEERYEVEKVKLGEGGVRILRRSMCWAGFGTVSRARDKATGARRARKSRFFKHFCSKTDGFKASPSLLRLS